MSSMTRKILRIVLGVAASLAVFFLLNLLPWQIDIAIFDVNQQYLLLAVTGAVSVFLATLAGAYVARMNFVGPAVLIGILAWALVISFLEAISSAYGPDDVVSFVVANAGGLAITIGGSVSGALIGNRFSNQYTGRVSSST